MAKLHGKRLTLILRHSAKYFSFWQIVSIHVLRSGQQIRQQTRILPELSNLSDWIPSKWIQQDLLQPPEKYLLITPADITHADNIAFILNKVSPNRLMYL